MVKLDDLDTSFLVPCKRCKELLQESERMCPFCGKDQAGGDEPASATSSDAIEASPGLAGTAFTDSAFDRPHHADRAGPPVRSKRRMLGVVAVLALLIGVFLVLDPLALRTPGGAPPPQPARELAKQVRATPTPTATTAPVVTASEPEAPATPPAPEACSEALRALSLCPSP